MGDAGVKSWRDFWGRSHRIYVNDRHLAVHCRVVADDILSLDPAPDAAVLDFGCGDALDAGRVAGRVARLYLYDAVPEVRARLRRRFDGQARIAIPDDQALAGPPMQGTIDLIVVNSVLQYVQDDEFRRLLALWRGLLKPGGRLVLADVIPPGDTLVPDTIGLLRFAWHEGFFLAAVAGLAATFFSDYRRLRQKLGLKVYGEEEMLKRLADAGFAAERRRPNFGFNQLRMTFVARPIPGTAR
ncbi:MAG: class I SAM-dependent methyltransferase [Alphaproteobacteria bacterium]|nr:class I SAM-dependent methyltransferase [Alphaproteobacteria bacterium]